MPTIVSKLKEGDPGYVAGLSVFSVSTDVTVTNNEIYTVAMLDKHIASIQEAKITAIEDFDTQIAVAQQKKIDFLALLQANGLTP